MRAAAARRMDRGFRGSETQEAIVSRRLLQPPDLLQGDALSICASPKSITTQARDAILERINIVKKELAINS
jgi:hypothetical protein